jgi:putative transcriptional regulator
MTGSLKGHLLVATPRLRDPNFDRTVILVLEHNEEEGAAGVVLNRPSDAEVAGSLPGWDSLAGKPAVFFAGGPVEPSGFIGLARLTSTGTVGPVDLAADPAGAAEVAEVRIFAGYAGWGPGQLEFEIGEGAWFVVDALPGDALSPVPNGLWSAVLRRQGGRLALLSNYPEDVATN